MAKPLVHAESSARRFGGVPEDYLELHDFMDSSKSVFPDNRHRVLTHNSWFFFIVERVFGHTITVSTDMPCDNCNGTAADDVWGGDQKVFEDTFCICNGTGKKPKQVHVRDICEQHVLEDFGGKFIPTPADYIEHMDFVDWMNNGIKGAPSSHRKLAEKTKKTRRMAVRLD